jgi:RecA-family ATPase
MSQIADLDSKRNARPSPLRIRDISELEGKPVPDRQWLIPGLLVHRGITMMSGDGGTGKSLICQQLQIAAALGKPWMGIDLPESLPSLGFYCEDDEDELHRRFYDICNHYGCHFRDVAGSVRYMSRVGEKNELMTFWSGRKGGDGEGQRTALLQQLEEDTRMLGTRLTVIDTVADTFAGNENIRPQVRSFITALRRLALINNGGVLVTAHPSVSGMADGSGRSGSTGWNGSVRSRVYFYKPKVKDQDIDGEEEPTNERILKTMKSNYGPAGEKMRCQWDAGVFVRTDIANSGANLFDRLDVQRKLVDAAADLIRNGEYLSPQVKSRTSLTALARSLPSCRNFSAQALTAAQRALLDAKRLEIVEAKRDGKWLSSIRPAHVRYPVERPLPGTTGETEQSIPVADTTPEAG